MTTPMSLPPRTPQKGDLTVIGTAHLPRSDLSLSAYLLFQGVQCRLPCTTELWRNGMAQIVLQQKER